MLGLIFRNFVRKTSKAIPKQTPKPPTTNKLEFPEDFKKLGLKKKEVDPEVADIYNRLKAKGADKLVDKIIDQKIKDGEEDELFSQVFQTDIGEERKLHNPKPDFPAENRQELMSYEEMEKYERNFPVELKEKAEKLLEQKVLESKLMENFKKTVSEDIDKATGRVDNRRELEKHEEFDDPFPLDEKEKHSYWDEMMEDLDPGLKKHFAQKSLNDKKMLVKHLQQLDKIQLKRQIRDLYKKFKIETRDENEPKKVDIYIESAQRNVKRWLEKILNTDKRVFTGEVFQNGFIEVFKVNLSPSMSVCTIFFDMFFPSISNRVDDPKRKEAIETVRRKLIHSSPYLRSKLTNCVGLKYAPELRWIPWTIGADQSQILNGVPDEETINRNLLTAKGEELKLITEPKLPGRNAVKNAKKRMKKTEEEEKDLDQLRTEKYKEKIKKEKEKEKEKEKGGKKHTKPFWIEKRDKEKKNIRYK
ncbi:unnamed protein product [Blepharisma stoltei]|uniref:Uncharacterized protein n=1 Tax=Blepharisma stoltei TaxID=1481888 RepID=A0AAU9JKV6_9CILI|nr:unnamed protein product [Blepharisma stoltei]